MHLLLLGSPSLKTDTGHLVEFDTRKSLALLAYLALHDEPFQRDTFAAMFWPDLDQSRARAALRRTLTPLNKALGDEALHTTRDTIALNPDFHLWVDARAFESAASDHNPESFQKAVALYKGDFMAGFTLRDAPEFDDWQFFEADRLRRLYASTLEQLILLLTAQGDFDPAIEHARAWLALDPLHEPAHRALMRLYAQTGQRAAALRQFRECIRILDEELGVTPLEETRQLYEEILEGKVTNERWMDVHLVEQPTPSQPETAQPENQITHQPAVQPIANLQTAIASLKYPLTGRTAELSTLLSAYDNIALDGYFIGIIGEAGIGKTRLAEEFLTQAQVRGAVTFTARCYHGEEQLAYAPFIEGIRVQLTRPDTPSRLAKLPRHYLMETARLLPEITDAQLFGPVQDKKSITHRQSPSSQTRLFESLRQLLLQLLSTSQPGILFIDDLQWADSASLDLLIFLARRMQDYPLLLLVTWRNEGDLSRLDGVLSEIQRDNLGKKMELARLTRAEVDELAENVIAPDRLQALFDETEGLPYFVVEYLSAARQQKDWSTLHSVRELERARLVGLDETAHQILATASVIGRSFEFDVLHTVSGRSEEETITGLETLLSRGLLVEQHQKDFSNDLEPPTFNLVYDFTHEKIRTVVYEDTTLARRRLLHRRVAQFLISQSSTSKKPHSPARIAHHLHHAGQEADAAGYYQQAGDAASKIYANAESLSHYQTALGLGHPEPGVLHEVIGDLQTLQGDYRTAVTSYETAAALAGADAISQIDYKLGNLHYRRGDYDLAVSFFQSALEGVENESQEFSAQILADWSRTCARQGNHLRARELAEDALARVQGTESISAGQAHNVLGMIARQNREGPRAIEHLQRAYEVAKTRNHLPAQIAALNNLALVYEDQQNYPRAVEFAQDALDLCARLGDRHREAALRNRLADLFHASGQPSAAMYHLKKAVEIFAEIGVEAGELEPEIWKLTEW